MRSELEIPMTIARSLPGAAVGIAAVLMLAACSSTSSPSVGASAAAPSAASAAASPSASAAASASGSGAASESASGSTAASGGASGGAAGGGCTVSTSAGAVKADAKGFAFTPATIQAKTGQGVTWTNGDAAPHTVTMDNNACSSDQIQGGQSVTIVFNAAGSYPYHCSLHPFMKGTVTVS
jgi:plastocyanin